MVCTSICCYKLVYTDVYRCALIHTGVCVCVGVCWCVCVFVFTGTYLGLAGELVFEYVRKLSSLF